MSLEYRIDVLQALKEAGFNTNRLRSEKLLSESTIQKLRNKEPISWDNLARICELLQCQPGEILVSKPEKESIAVTYNEIASRLGLIPSAVSKIMRKGGSARDNLINQYVAAVSAKEESNHA